MSVGAIQEWVRSRLAGFDALDGITVLSHDGSDTFLDDSQDRANALATKGLCITVFPPEGIETADTEDSLLTPITVGVAVLIQENAKAGASETGCGITAAQAVDIVMGCIGPINIAGGQALTLDRTPFQSLGLANGVRSYVVLFTTNIAVSSTQS